MELYVKKLVPGSKLVHVCPDHPDMIAEKPGACTKEKCAKKLAFKVVSEGTQLAETWMCPLHPEHASQGKAKCPRCGGQMKHLEIEQVLAVPFPAVIDTGRRKLVFLERGDGVFDAVAIEVGPRGGDYYPVLKGLAAGDRVVARGAFLLDAEAQLTNTSILYFGSGEPGGKK